jgi:hypothetical protein
MKREANSIQVPAGSPSVPLGIQPTKPAIPAADSGSVGGEEAHTGLLIVNADDWGRSSKETDAILDCALRGAVSSGSAMVFMEDSERSAVIALERGIDVGLHLNFTTSFTAPHCPTRLVQHQQGLARHLLRHRLAQIVFHPGLVGSFEYVVRSQLDEFSRLYQRDPDRLDGHHHMHLCANVLLGGLLPPGTLVRRNFSFRAGEKSYVNRLYRQLVDLLLGRRHRLADFFFSLPPFEPPDRLQRIFSLARQYVVEVETHPVNPEEYEFLAGGEIYRRAGNLRVARRFGSDGWPQTRNSL